MVAGIATSRVMAGGALLALALAGSVVPSSSASLSMTTSSEKRVSGCEDIRVSFSSHGDDLQTVRSEERLAAPPAGEALSVAPPQNGGVFASGWDGDGYEIVACKVAAARTEEKARSVLEKISVHREEGGLTATGPAGDSWTAFFIVKAPEGATLDLSVQNGGIDTREITGTIRAHSMNGPISIDGCAGDIDAAAENGPVSLKRSRGEIRIRTENGPISLSVQGSGWKDGRLDAHAVNGPLTLELPAGFQSGVRVEAPRHAPFNCDARPCDGSRRSPDGSARRLDLGGAEMKVFVSTVNGPISIVPPNGEI